MSQIFHPSMNTLAKASIFGAVFIIAAVGWVASAVDRSPYNTDAGVVRSQPVPFSHEHHVAGLGIDCRYCHTSVEVSPFAGMPSTKTCMTCHSQIWTNAALLAPVRESWNSGAPIKDATGHTGWTRVHKLPDFVYFNHSIHLAKGVGCVTCHGRVDKMPLMYQHASLQMEWCLDCHRNPEKFVRPRDQVFSMNWDAEKDPLRLGETQATLGPKLVEQYQIHTSQLSNCYVCHR